MKQTDTILILSSNFGQGHMATARALQSAAQNHSDLNFTIEVVDFSEAVSQIFNTASKKIYELNAKHAPIFHKWIYTSTDKSSLPLKIINDLNYPIRRKALSQIIAAHNPSVILSNYPIWQRIAYQLAKENFEQVEFATLVTDSISIHSSWAEPDSDLYFVANEPTAASVHKLGVANKKIFTLGYPTHDAFSKPLNKKALRDIGLDLNVPYILFSASSLRSTYVRKVIVALARQLTDHNIVVVAGRDKRLYSLLQNASRPLPDNVQLIGWTDQMPELIKGSQIVITKAGGSTVMECVAARKPMVINKVIPGQEEGNAELVARFGLGEVASEPEDIVDAIKQITTHPEGYQVALSRESHPQAALDILRLLRDRLDHNHTA